MRTLTRWLFALALSTVAATASPAATDLDLNTILARHAQALGGLDRIRALKAVRTEGTLSMGGLTGRMRDYALFPGRSRTEIELAFIHQVAVQDGAAAWVVDQNGQVRDLEGPELQVQQAQACLASFRYLLAPPGEVTVKFSGQEPESTQYVHLDVGPAGGTPLLVCLDPSTWLVRKIVAQMASGRMESYLSDYREVGGVRMAFRSVQMLGGDAARAYVVQIQSAMAAEDLPDTLWRRPGASTRDWALPEEVRSVSVPVEVYQHHVFVRVRVNGSEPLSFLLDSGAGATVIEKRRADALGLKSEGKLGAHGVGGSADYSLGRLDSLMVGGAVLRRQNVVIMALPDIGDVLGRPLDGILGYDFISRFVVTIDYSHQVVTLTEPGAWTAPAGARAVPLELLQNVPVVQASCDGRYAGRFVVDTGNNSTVLLHAPFVREHKLLERASRKIDMRSLGAGGQETHTMVRMDSLVIGGLTVPRPLVSLSLASTGMTGAGTQLAGNIGGWILERFTVTFDYDGRKMYLEPGPKLAEPMSIGRIGWQVARIKGHLEVVAVSEGTPAAEAGVEAGDVLLKLGDEGLGDVDVPALRRLTDQDPGTRLRFEIRRDGQTRQVELTLRELL